MTERDKLKLLADIPESDKTKDEFLDLLIEQAKSYLLSYCRVDFVDESMLPIVLRMAAEDYGRSGSEGVSYRSVSGAAESYLGEYSPRIMIGLRRLRRMGGLGC